ncbi:MAG: hypothetical protein EOO62_34555 [Hymenobacter sp.]|nr:MAG: hypothetical protein EOO62_34555 [Hymenobacter sp.]
MSASSHRSFSSLCSTMQELVIQLIQEDLHPFLQVPPTTTEEVWCRAIRTANPTLFCHYTDIFTIKICPESRSGLLQRLQQELSAAS